MNKKYTLIINMTMIVIGLIGILFHVMKNDNREHTKITEKESPVEYITVALAKKQISKGVPLSIGDYELKTISSTTENKNRYLIKDSIENWMLSEDVGAGSFIPIHSLINPTSDNYIKTSLSDGEVAYKVELHDGDEYIHSSLNVGSKIDIYFSYGLVKLDSGQIVPTTKPLDIDNRHFKLLLKSKVILSMGDDFLLIKVSNSELKTIKGLDGAKLYVFPSHSLVTENNNMTQNTEWPIDNRNVLSVDSINEAKELRGKDSAYE